MTLLYRQIRQQMEEQVAQKSSELEQYLQRVRELEDMYLKLQEALEDERQARQDEETVRKLQARCQTTLYSVLLVLCLGGQGPGMANTLVEREESARLEKPWRLGWLHGLFSIWDMEEPCFWG